MPAALIAAQGAAPAPAAPPSAGRGASAPAPVVVSPEVLPDRRVVFRLYAPQATDVVLRGPSGAPPQMTKQANGVWETTIGPLAPGVYQYSFGVHGVSVVDPANMAINETTAGLRNTVVVPGGEWTDMKDVPHGAVAEVFYPSAVLGRTRRLHVYTPPGYTAGTQRYPVFYLLHGSGDSDQSWNALGRAGVIVDNLIAAGRARPMIVVMPDGHTRTGAERGTPQARTEFVREFMADILPFVESHYRVRAERNARAIAGLSDGRRPHAQHRDPQPGEVRVHRRVQRRPVGRRRGAAFGSRDVRRRQSRRARQRLASKRREAALVQHGPRRFGDGEHEERGRAAREARLHAGVQGERGRSHVGELERLSRHLLQRDLQGLTRPIAPRGGPDA
ncbi:MAG: hypothetical protein IT184_12145 [Acidobacteria bacterium]|nr:hypothetical protein [Acidobacteriota bacterium]